MNLSDFDALRRSLCKFEPAVQAFCVQYGFKQRAIGRYPKLRLERTRADSQINQWIDLWMKYDDEGKYRTSWDEKTPFELNGGADLSFDSDGKIIVRYVTCEVWQSMPYEEAVLSIVDSLEKLLIEIEKITRDDIENSKKIQGGVPWQV